MLACGHARMHVCGGGGFGEPITKTYACLHQPSCCPALNRRLLTVLIHVPHDLMGGRQEGGREGGREEWLTKGGWGRGTHPWAKVWKVYIASYFTLRRCSTLTSAH